MEIPIFGIDYSHHNGEFCPRGIHPYYVLCYFSTPFLYEIDGKLLQGEAGDVLIMEPQRMVYHGPISDTECFINDWFWIRGERFEELLQKYPLPLNKSFPISNPNLVKSCIRKVADELTLKQIGYQDKIAACLTETMVELHRANQMCGFSAGEFKIAAMRDLFLRNVEKNWTLQELASLCGYSVSRLLSIYKEQFGSSPKADIMAARIEKAKRLLYYSEMSVTEIAAQCGFHSIYFFSKYFKETVGMTPREYTKKHINL